jgi:glycerol-3-phosphate dehydrogenase (NAD(P)+)
MRPTPLPSPKRPRQMSPDKPATPPPTAVIGAGAWGTALAAHLRGLGAAVRLWAYEPEVADAVTLKRENPLYLPGVSLPSGILATTDLQEALTGTCMVLLVMPSHVFRPVLIEVAPHLSEQAPIIACAKGIEESSGFTMCQVARDVLPESHHPYLCCLSGPSFAKEVASGIPTAVVVASKSQAVAVSVQLGFSSPAFRAYTSSDLTGVELGGAVKNPLAIAAGMCEGLGMGHNTLAAMVTRGLAEMSRLSLALGGMPETTAGLSGLGDLTLTCYGDLSRNRQVGIRLGKGENIRDIKASMHNVAEGVINTKTVLALADKVGVEMPIVTAVYQVIYQGLEPMTALNALMTRGLKPEHY